MSKSPVLSTPKGTVSPADEWARVRNVLVLPMSENDAGAATVRDYLKVLLLRVWDEEEGFSGKRPFGNGGWKHDIYRPLIKFGFVAGCLDADGFIDSVDKVAADKLIRAAIASF